MDTTSVTRRTLLIGIDDAPPVPMQLGSPQTGDFRGYEVDVLEELARQLDVALRYRRAYWSAIVGDLAAGRVDAVCSAATVTPERARDVDFCTPHLTLTLAVVTRVGDPAVLQLNGQRVGVRAGTTAEAYASAQGVSTPTMRSESNDELYAALAANALDAIIDDSPIAAHFAHSIPGLILAGALPNTEASYAIMVRKGNHALRDTINAALATMGLNGTLRLLRSQWNLPPE